MKYVAVVALERPIKSILRQGSSVKLQTATDARINLVAMVPV